MTAVEKFAICRALFHSQTYPEPVAAQQYRMAVNAVAKRRSVIDSPVRASPELIEFVQGWESCRLSAYLDGNGVPTIGWGHTLGVRMGNMITQAQADSWLIEELIEYGEALKVYMTREPLQQQFDALLSLSYNAGVRAIGKAGVMTLFNAGDDQACADRFLQWNRDGGREVLGLTKRRRAERAIYLDGDYGGRP